jgi:hypothetical protein
MSYFGSSRTFRFDPYNIYKSLSEKANELNKMSEIHNYQLDLTYDFSG